MPLCRYKISHHIFTLVLNCIREAACRYAAIRLALIFSLLYSTVLLYYCIVMNLMNKLKNFFPIHLIFAAWPIR